jgi:Transglutaminase-like superfamily
MKHAGLRTSDEYRIVPETRIRDMLLLAGWVYERDSAQALAATQASINHWIDAGLGVRVDKNGERYFDPVEVLNVFKQLGLRGKDSFWAERFVQTGRRLVTDFAAEDQGLFRVKFERTFRLNPAQMGKSIRLRAPLPLASVYGDTLKVEPLVTGSSHAQISMSNGRLEARLKVAGEELVSLGATLQFGASLPRPVSRPANDSPYLKPREGLIAVTDRVKALAWSLTEPDAGARSTARAFWSYIIDELICGGIHYDQINAAAPCDWILETGWYDCQLGAALFAAMCRARGIPSRIVGGYLLYRLAPTNHYWAEAWFDDTGWTPFDFLSFDLSLGGRDPQWRDKFQGSLDSRMVTEIFPLEFTGALGLPVPEAWHILQTPTHGGVEIALSGNDGGAVYSDKVSIA